MQNKIRMAKVSCSDWHRNWSGLVGTLTKTAENSYKWYGQYVGRHGQTGRTYSVDFKFIDGVIIREGGDPLPNKADVIAAINEIANEK